MPVTIFGKYVGVVGGLFGFGVHAYSNAVRKVRITFRPWEIPIAVGLGYYAFTWWDGICERAAEKHKVLLAERIANNQEAVPPPHPMPLQPR